MPRSLSRSGTAGSRSFAGDPCREGLDHLAGHARDLEAPVGVTLLDFVAEPREALCELAAVDHADQLLPAVERLVRHGPPFAVLAPDHGHRDVWVRGYVERVVIGCGGEVIARHPRSYEREDTIFEPIHYLPLIEQKIGALDQAAPLAGWELPPAFQTLRRLMEARSPKAGRREYVQVLRLLESFGLEDLDGAVKDALRLGAIGFDAVKHLVLCRVEKRPPKLDLDVYPYLPKATIGRTSATKRPASPSSGACSTPNR